MTQDDLFKYTLNGMCCKRPENTCSMCGTCFKERDLNIEQVSGDLEKKKKTRKKQVEMDFRYKELMEGMQEIWQKRYNCSISTRAIKADWVNLAKMLRRTKYDRVMFSVDRLLYSFSQFVVKMADFPIRVWCSAPERWFPDRQDLTRDGLKKAADDAKRKQTYLSVIKQCAIYAPETLTDDDIKELNRIGFDPVEERKKLGM